MNPVKWTAGKCCHGECPLTLVTYIGGNLWVCWMHALLLGIIGDVP